jgi:hypothetical protein
VKQVILVTITILTCASCDYVFNITGPTSTVNSTNTNTNTNTVDFDLHDLVNFNPVFGGGGGTTPPGNVSPEVPLPIPAGAQATAQGVANNNPFLIANSCQDTQGQSAWVFMDLVVSTLRQFDTRWGYICKRNVCSDISRDVIGYRATSDNVGAWGVDIIAGHCGPNPTFSWNVIGFDPDQQWQANR